ncbi:hypothetical protein [Nostoc sp. 'Peltigera malacea cyanobiont' DB3992]|uniref:hypothetical protein n=1 Tax=Nostoc sp. 'Peltigera malacea cyanobiont' DB3992 TaxID=1206980 RepID=UPI0011808238|nr:hypothetical protein [Nostoc sp. 'Peltigera malacea cyanobiont' DB3992]
MSLSTLHSKRFLMGSSVSDYTCFPDDGHLPMMNFSAFATRFLRSWHRMESDRYDRLFSDASD